MKTSEPATEPVAAGPGPVARLRALLARDTPAGRVASAALVIGAAMAVVGVWVGPYIVDPTRLPPGADLPWYLWRTELLLAEPGRTLVEHAGPMDLFGGGYRIVTPALGGMVRRLTGIDTFTLSVVLIPLRQVLVSLALGAVAYRYRKDPLLFAVVALFAAGALFVRPFVGYTDAVVSLLLVSGALWFLESAAREWPARAALFTLVLLAFFAHPPVAGLFVAVVAAAFAVGAVVRRSVRPEGWTLAVTLGAALVAWLAWQLGVFGPGRSFGSAVNVPPYSSELFFGVVGTVVAAMEPWRLVPLAAAGVACLVATRSILGSPLVRTILVWLLPPLGVLAYFAGLRFPYKRLLSSTLAPVLVAGIGLWALAKPMFAARRVEREGQGARWPIGVAIIVAVVAPMWIGGLARIGAQPGWIRPEVRAALASVTAYLGAAPEVSSVVFVASADPGAGRAYVWGQAWRGTWSRVRLAVPGRLLTHTHLFVGAARDFLAGHPSRTGSPMLDRVSEISFADAAGARVGREPVVFMIEPLNRHLGNAAYLDAPTARPVTPELSILSGPGLAEPDLHAAAEARMAGEREAIRQGASWRFPPAGRLLRVGAGLALLLVVPGLLSARWFGVAGLPSLVGLVPVLSLGLNLVVALALLAVSRLPLGPGPAWTASGLATLGGAALFLAGRSRGADHPPTT